MSDKKDLYEDRYVLDDYDTPSFYGKSADKYFGDIDRDSKELRGGGYSRHNDLYEPTNYLKDRGMSRQEMEYYAGVAGIRNVSNKDDMKAVYKAYVDDKAGGRNQQSIDDLRDEFNAFKNQKPEDSGEEKEKPVYTESQTLKDAKERAQNYKQNKTDYGTGLFNPSQARTSGFTVDTDQPNVTTEAPTYTNDVDADPDKQEYGQLIFS